MNPYLIIILEYRRKENFGRWGKRLHESSSFLSDPLILAVFLKRSDFFLLHYLINILLLMFVQWITKISLFTLSKIFI